MYFLRFYLFTFREERKEKEGRETSVCGCLSCTPSWGPGPQPRHVPWLGTEPTTLWFTGPHSIHWVTPARLPTYLPTHLPTHTHTHTHTLFAVSLWTLCNSWSSVVEKNMIIQIDKDIMITKLCCVPTIKKIKVWVILDTPIRRTSSSCIGDIPPFTRIS